MNIDKTIPLIPSISSLSDNQLVESTSLPRYLQPGTRVSLPKMLRWARIDAREMSAHRLSILLAAVEKSLTYPADVRMAGICQIETMLLTVRREMMRIQKRGIPSCGLRLAEKVHGADYCKRLFRSVVMSGGSSGETSPWLAKQMRKSLGYIG